METLGVVAGRVVKVRPHPDGEKIWLADIDVGADYQPQIVWGGVPVVEEGSLVPVALPGARLPTGRIRRRRYRGEPSEGMLCSLAELGWDSAISDRVALLDSSAGLRPGDSLDTRASDWQSIVLAPALMSNKRQSTGVSRDSRLARGRWYMVGSPTKLFRTGQRVVRAHRSVGTARTG